MNKHREAGFGSEHTAETSEADTAAQATQTATQASQTAATSNPVTVGQPTEAQRAAQAAVAAGGGGSKDGAKVLLADGTPRVDYIKRRWAEGASRGAIVKELNDPNLATPGGKPVPYQIVFAATKTTPRGEPAPGPTEVHPDDIAAQQEAEAEVGAEG